MRLLKLVPDNTNLKFVSLRKWAFGLTLLLSLLAIGLVVTKGLNMGVDFVGGVLIEEKFATPPSIDAVRTEVDRLGVGEASIQSFSDPKTLSIRLPVPAGDEGATNRLVKKVSDDLAVKFPGATFSKYDTISGKVSDELISKGLLAVGLAILGIALFAVVRFEWQFGVSTVVAIVHDLLMTLGFFALTQFEFDLNIVAAVLTIISYSINDKIVIDDRIRENMRRYRKMDMREIIDLSVNETLPRTVMTSVTILLALVAMLVLGGHVLRGFTAAMILGIVVGTYSSIYVSSSLLITLGLRADPAPRKGGVQDGAERVGPKVER
ncbi:protein translocase subunit secF [Sphingomonas sp. PP-CE-1A-559]|jgi:preprotein translocase subunit SecF|uniref:protein translocase subunit SecF n=1 Tax=Sphingomonas TaxID=13687 RepID=UPI0010515FF4|nr:MULTISPECIES: protein translocase subunit SecF [unclassified Sphingomonas]MDD1451602.1 protein translocase subunit SecF [Sphingomonas sp. H160509]QCB40885.1 protein translocase subunit SecF [Sphingomonas sp. PAMC26645]TCP91965.1 protein translocase subunit secF [Sphingomonas sp. PP-CE-1A-559]TCP99315.1 protein translocase subunit secF [Sphingomonas sp. PP-F2F-A104-K0414]